MAAPTAPSSFTFPILPEQIQALRALLDGRGFVFSEAPYAAWRAVKGKLNVIAYTSGKLLVQGKEAAEFVEFVLEPEIFGEAKLGYDEVHNPRMFEPHVGIDESGKGDFFGPLVIAAAYTDAALTREFMTMGVRDSKAIGSDRKIADLAEAIRRQLGRRCAVIIIGPAKYNELVVKFRNLNRLLAWGHATALENVLAAVPDCPRALSDQFADPALIAAALKNKGRQVLFEARTKGESDVAVAAASILARAAFVEQLQQLGDTAGVSLLKGASAAVLDAARSIVQERGEPALRQLAKAHFRTYELACGRTPPERKPWRKPGDPT